MFSMASNKSVCVVREVAKLAAARISAAHGKAYVSVYAYASTAKMSHLEVYDICRLLL